MADSNFSNIRKLIILDQCFRCTDPKKCTMEYITNIFKDHPDYGLKMSKSSFHCHLNNFQTMGAKFKGKESKKTNNFIYAKGDDGKTAIYQYEDPNIYLEKLAEIVGEQRQNAANELLSLLENVNSDTNSVLVWLKIYLNKMLKGECDSPLDVVSFYENSDSNIQNIKKFEALLQAILNKQPIEVFYRQAKRPSAKMQPLLLKNYNQRWYLIAKVRNHEIRKEHLEDYYEGYSPIALNEIIDIKPWEEAWIEPDWDELKEYYDDKIGVSKSDEGPQKVYLRFDKERYEKYVATKPIVGSQKEVRVESKYYDPERPTISINVHITKELIQQILSFGPDCEVIAPESLRTQIKEMIQAMAEKY